MHSQFIFLNIWIYGTVLSNLHFEFEFMEGTTTLIQNSTMFNTFLALFYVCQLDALLR